MIYEINNTFLHFNKLHSQSLNCHLCHLHRARSFTTSNMESEPGSISMHDEHGVHLGTVTSEQVQCLFSVLNNTTPVIDKYSQVSGRIIKFSVGSVSQSKPQPHLLAQGTPSPSQSFLQGTPSLSHFISSAGIKNSLTLPVHGS